MDYWKNIDKNCAEKIYLMSLEIARCPISEDIRFIGRIRTIVKLKSDYYSNPLRFAVKLDRFVKGSEPGPERAHFLRLMIRYVIERISQMNARPIVNLMMYRLILAKFEPLIPEEFDEETSIYYMNCLSRKVQIHL